MSVVFDPAAVERPQIKLPSGVFSYAEITASRQRKLAALQSRLEALDPDDPNANDAIRILCDQLEIILESADGVADSLYAAYEADQVSQAYLMRALAHGLTWVQESASLGEG